MQSTCICYSICERKKYKYITRIEDDVMTLGAEKDRVMFYDETEAENYRQLAENTMTGCFQIVVEKLATNTRIERILENEKKNPLEIFDKSSDAVLDELRKGVEINVDGLSHKIFQIYSDTTDKNSIKEIFEAIFGVSFEEYLAYCEHAFETNDT